MPMPGAVAPLEIAPATTEKAEAAYRRLLRVVRAARGMFALVVVESDEQVRRAFLERLRDDLGREGIRLCVANLGYRRWDPVEALSNVEDPASTVVALLGLEATPPGPLATPKPERPPAFARLNQLREVIEHRAPVPLLIWTDSATVTALQRHAPDFFDHFAGIVRFPPSAAFEGEATAVHARVLRETETAVGRRGPKLGGIRFYEELLETSPEGSPQHRRALLGLAEALLDLPRLDALQSAESALEALDQALAADPEPEERARALHLRGTALDLLGRVEDALAAIVEASEVYRHLASRRPEAFASDLAGSLNNLGNRLGDLGRLEEALTTIEQAVEIYRRLAAARPEAFLPDLANLLNNLGTAHGNLGQREPALVATNEAVEIDRRLALRHPETFRPDLARSLNNLGIRLGNLGRRGEALAATEEAVEILRRLASSRPDAFLPDLAMSLNNLGNMLSDLDRQDEALAATQEAVEIRRRLASSNPYAFLPGLAMSLNNLGLRLGDVDRPEEAVAASEEAVSIRRRLAASRPDAFLPNLASSLNNLGNSLSGLGRPEEALVATEEAVGIYRRLASSRPDAFLPDLARTLTLQASLLRQLGRSSEAAVSGEEALRLVLPFVERYPVALGGLGETIREEYTAACEESRHVAEPDLLQRIESTLSAADR